MSIYEFPKTEIKNINGISQVFVNGTNLGLYRAYVASESYFCMGKEDLESVKNFYEAGFRQFNVLFFPNIFWRDVEVFDYEKCFEHLQGIINRILYVAPDAFILIRWSFFVPEWWCEKFPEETFEFSEKVDYLQNQPGGKHPASYASKVWRRQQREIAEQIFERIKLSSIAERIMGFRLAYGNCGEWNSVGYLEELCADYSKPMLLEFRQWLAEKYAADENLSHSWKIDGITFDTALFPDKAQRLSGNGIFRPANSMQVVDYYMFWQSITVSTIEYFAKLFKEMTDGNCIVGAFYGYYLTHMWQGPYHSIESGHYALGQSLDSEYLDFVGGPYPYNDRKEYAPINAAYSSVNLRKKIWDTENDQRTHLCDQNQVRYGKTSDVEESVAIAVRDFAMNTVKGCHSYFYDFAKGWYNDGKFMRVVKRLKEIDNILIDKPIGNNQIAVFVCESTMSRLVNDCHSMKALSKTLMCELDASGVPWDMYLIEDIGKVRMSQYKLAIIANSYFLDKEHHQEILKLKEHSDLTLMYMYGVAVIDGQNVGDVNSNYNITGFKTTLTNDPMGGVVWDDYQQQKFDISPWLRIDDDQAEIWAKEDNNNGAVIGYKRDAKGFAEIFCASPWLDRELLRRIYKPSKVHIYSENNGLFFKGKGIVCLYSREIGTKKIVFQEKQKYIVNLVDKSLITDCSMLEFEQRQRIESFLYYAGDDEALAQKLLR